MWTEKLRPRILVQAVLTRIADNTCDLQCYWSLFTATDITQRKTFSHRVLVGPVTFRHRVIDYRNLLRVFRVELVEHAAPQKLCADRTKISSRRNTDLGDRFLAGW